MPHVFAWFLRPEAQTLEKVFLYTNLVPYDIPPHGPAPRSTIVPPSTLALIRGEGDCQCVVPLVKLPRVVEANDHAFFSAR